MDEHKYIFHDLFGTKSEIFEKITRYLADGPAEFSTLAEGIKYASSGTLTNYLEDLIESGYIRKDLSWSLKSATASKISLYSLRDNYLRFYYKYVLPKLNLIKKGQYKEISISKLPGFNSVIGLQFETLILNNAVLIHEILNVRAEDVLISNRYYQRPTKRIPGCQIDYLIQTRQNVLFVCEIKFSQSELNATIISEVKNKIARIAKPKNMTCIPVLIHVNGVNEQVADAGYFYKIINFSELLQNKI